MSFPPKIKQNSNGNSDLFSLKAVGMDGSTGGNSDEQTDTPKGKDIFTLDAVKKKESGTTSATQLPSNPQSNLQNGNGNTSGTNVNPFTDNNFGTPTQNQNSSVTTNDGVQFSLNNLPVPKDALPQIANNLQNKINTKTITPADVQTIANASGKNPLAVWGYINEGATKGAAIENNQYVQDQQQKIKDYIGTFNKINGTQYNPDEVMSSADNLNNFLTVAKTKNVNAPTVQNPNYAPTDATTVRTLPTNLKTPLPFDLSNDIINQVVQKTVSELPKDEAIDKIANILNPKDYQQSQRMAASVTAAQNYLKNAPTPYNVFSDKLNQKLDLFNYQKGIAELKYNEALKQNSINQISQGTISGDQNLVKQGQTSLASVDNDVVDKYPALLKQQIAQQVNDYIAKQSGVVQGNDAQSLNDYKEKVFGTSTQDRINAMQALGILSDPKKKDIAESMAGNSEYFANNSILGSVVPSFLQPFQELGMSLGDMTGIRAKSDILSDKIKDQLFPKDFSGNDPNDPDQLHLKNSVQYSRNIVNTTANLAGMLAIASATEGIGEGLGVSTSAAQKLGAYTSFGMPAFDQSLKNAPESITSEPAKYLYAAINSIANAEGGRVLDLGKITRIEGVDNVFAQAANKISNNSISEEGLKDLLATGKNKYVDFMQKFATKYPANVVKGAATMAYFNVANNVVKMAFGDQQAQQDLLPQAGHAFLDGLLGMSIMGGFGAVADMKNEKNTSFKGSIYNMALNHSSAADVFKMGLDKGDYTKPQYDEKMQILNTAISAKNALDATIGETGINLDAAQKSVYVANKTAQAVLENKANESGIPDETKNMYLQQAKRLAEQSIQTLDGLKFTPTLEPLYNLYDAEKQVNEARGNYNPSDKKSSDDLESATQNYQKLYSDYLKNNSDPSINGKVEEPESNEAPVVNRFAKAKAAQQEAEQSGSGASVIQPLTDEQKANNPTITIAPKEGEQASGKSTKASVILPETVKKQQANDTQTEIPNTQEAGSASNEGTDKAIQSAEESGQGQNRFAKAKATKAEPINVEPLDKAKELVNSGVVKGYTAEVLKDAANNNPEEFKSHLKDIADQANDPQSNKATVDTYGKDLVDIAQKLNPTKEESVSTTTPIEGKKVSTPTEIIEDSEGVKTFNKNVNTLSDLTERISKSNEAYTSIKGFDDSFNGFVDWVKDNKDDIGYKGSAIGHLSKLQEENPEAVTKLLGDFVESKDFKKYNSKNESTNTAPTSTVKEPTKPIEVNTPSTLENKKEQGSTSSTVSEPSNESHREDIMTMLSDMKDSKFGYRISSDISQKEREKGVSDLRNGKDSAAARKVKSLVDDIINKGELPIHIGIGGQIEKFDIPFEHWFGLEPKEREAAEKMDDVTANIINDEGITKNNIDNLKHLFNGFPYTEEDFNKIKAHLEGQDAGNVNAKENVSPSKPKEEAKGINFDILQTKVDGKDPLATEKNVIKEIIQDGVDKNKDVPLEDILKEAKEGGYDKKGLEDVETAYHELVKESGFEGEGDKTELTNPIAKRINAAVSKMFGEKKNYIEVTKNSDEVEKMAKGKDAKFSYEDYAGEHRAPNKDDTPLYDLTNAYGDDIYSNKASYYFGDGNVSMDKKSVAILQNIKGKPDAKVTVYRAVPKEVKEKDINNGDWVSINKEYAINHGKAYLDGKYKIIQKTVEAKQLFTDGNSLHEQGVSFMRNDKGEILGFADPISGRIVLNGEKLNPNTPLHEAGHLFTEWAKQNNEPVYKRGIELITPSKYLRDVSANEFYKSEALKAGKEGTPEYKEYLQHEALAKAIGDKGAQFITEAKRKSFKEWAKNLWESIGKKLGFKDVTPEELSNMTLDEFSKRAATDILKGEPQEGEKAEQPKEENSGNKKPPVDNGNETNHEDNKYPGKTSGIAERVKRQRGIQPDSGEGWSRKEANRIGKELIASGIKPEDVISDFKEDGTISGERMAVVNEHANELARETERIGDDSKLGIDSKEYKEALQKEKDWAKEVQPMQTEWQKAGAAQGGETEINTGSFTGLRKEFTKWNDKEPSKSQEGKLKDLSSKVKELNKKLSDLAKKVSEKLDDNLKDVNNKSKISDKFKDAADTFRKLKSKPFVFKDSNGNEFNITTAGLTWNDIVEFGAKAIEKTGDIADGISAIVDKVKDSDWYKKFSDKDKSNFEDQLKNHFDDILKTKDSEEEKNIARLEKELEKVKSDAGKEKEINEPNKRDLSDREKELKSQIAQEKDKQQFKNLVDRFADKVDNKFSPQDAKDIWNYATKTYLDRNEGDFNDMVTKTAKDLGLTPQQVIHSIEQQKGAKPITDQMYRTQRDRRLAHAKAANYVKSADGSKVIKFLKNIPSSFFRLATFGHGTVGFITHAGTSIFNPSTWHIYFPLFFKQFNLAYVSMADYEKAMADLKRDPLFPLAKSSGLAVDPDSVYDDYQTTNTLLRRIGAFGDRGFNVLKVLRMGLFKHYYDKLSDADKADKDVSKTIASIVNHGTGTSNVRLPDITSSIIFAAHLEGSRWNRLIMQPTKAAATFIRWNHATNAEKVGAKIVAKRAGTIMGTYMGMLAANQAILSLVGSKQSINFTNPTQSDFLKFKFEGKTLDLSGGMISTFDFLARIFHTAHESQKELKRDSRGEALGKAGVNYVSNKLSPFAGDMKEFLTQHNFSGNTVPFSKDKPYYKNGHKMTWKEYISEKLPIPASAAFHDVYDQMYNSGMSHPQINQVLGGIFVGVVEGGIGARVAEDHALEKKK